MPVPQRIAQRLFSPGQKQLPPDPGFVRGEEKEEKKEQRRPYHKGLQRQFSKALNSRQP